MSGLTEEEQTLVDKVFKLSRYALMKHCELSEEQAVAVIKAIACEQIDNIKIHYY